LTAKKGINVLVFSNEVSYIWINMKPIKFLFFFFPVVAVLFSCPPYEEEEYGIYYKSTFLGSDSFQLKGSIYDRAGKSVSGKKILARISYYESDDWRIEGNLNKNQFSLDINKVDNNGNSLPIVKNDDKYRYDEVWEIFTAYFSVPENKWGERYNERDKKMFLISLYLDEDKYLFEFIGNKPTKYYTYDIYYVYIPEPVNISGNYRFDDSSGENYFSFDCDFSKPGFYKIYIDMTPIGKNKAYTSSINTKYCKD
jgi:hypothetical protein